MKHQKEWHTCDRCGVEIEYNYSAGSVNVLCATKWFITAK